LYKLNHWNNFLLWPAAGVGAIFPKYVFVNATTKKMAVFDNLLYSDASKITWFDVFMKNHINFIQKEAKKHTQSLLQVPTSCGGMWLDSPWSCTFWQSVGKLLQNNWNTVNNKQIFMNHGYNTSKSSSYPNGLRINITRWLQWNIVLTYLLWVDKQYQVITTIANIDWTKNQIDVKSIIHTVK
jgi:hypothetical protein